MEPDFIQDVLDRFQEETGLKTHWKGYRNQQDADGLLTIAFHDRKEAFEVECKREILPVHLPNILAQQKRKKPYAVIAGNILPRAKEELRRRQIAYFDLAGNAFIQTPRHFVFIDGKRPVVQKTAEELRNRAFTKAGLRVVFNLLIDPNLVNANYRKIAEVADVALDTVNKTFLALKNLGHLINARGGEFKLIKQRRLAERWTEAYPGRLRPALHIGNFRFMKEDDQRNWKKLPLDKQKTQWGGEPAADLLTDYLRPTVFTIYTEEAKNELMKKYRFIPDVNGPVRIYTKFWAHDEMNFGNVPPLLVYADLMNTEDPRTIETAQKLYDEYLKNRFD